MSKKRTKKQKIKAQISAEKQLPLVKKQLASHDVEMSGADLLMSQPAELQSDFIKTGVVTLICILVLVGLYWQFR